jgi:hypothetical protein
MTDNHRYLSRLEGLWSLSAMTTTPYIGERRAAILSPTFHNKDQRTHWLILSIDVRYYALHQVNDGCERKCSASPKA